MKPCRFRIKDLPDTHSEVILFTRPRRFGKTLNMSMLQTFFEKSDKDTSIQQGYSGNFYEKVIEFMRNFFSGGLKDNQNPEFGVLTGILRISKENLFSGLNNPIVNTVVDEAFSEYFGFTCDEVAEIARYYGKSDKLSELAELMSGKSVLTPLNMELIYPQVENDLGGLYSFLLVSGYLKLDAPIDETSYGTYAMVSIPNIEIRRVYESEVLAWIKTDTNAAAIMNIKSSLFTADGLLLKKSIREFIIHSVSFFDASTEGFYHGMILLYFRAITSSRE